MTQTDSDSGIGKQSGKPTDQRIVFFDGVCNLCNNFVDFLLGWDKSGRMKFAPLQGKSADQILGPRLQFRADLLNSVIYFRDGKIFDESTAALFILSDLGGIWILARVCFVIPKFLRDMVYRFVARNRYHLFGVRDTCRMPTAEEKSHFLD